MSDDFDTRIQRKAEEHLIACDEALLDEDARSPAYGPYDGCQTCIVREVLSVAWDDLLAEAEKLARGGDDDWYVPGGAVVDDSRQVRLRLRPPASWVRFEIDLPRTPPSMNTNEVRSHWTGFHEHKKSWQTEIEQLLMVAKVRRAGYQRAIVGGFLRFPAKAARRDSGNFEHVLNKACGDALVDYRAIPDDDAPHYFFGGVEIEEETGPSRTRLWIYLQPKEG